jgi:hypothetical protein
MKNFLCSALIFALMLTAACGGNPAEDLSAITSENHGQPTPAEATESAPDETAPFPGVLAETRNFSVWVKDGWEHNAGEDELRIYSHTLSESMAIMALPLSAMIYGNDALENATRKETLEFISEILAEDLGELVTEVSNVRLGEHDAVEITAIGRFYIIVDDVNFYSISVTIDEVFNTDIAAMLQTFTLNPNAVEVVFISPEQAIVDATAKNIHLVVNNAVSSMDSMNIATPKDISLELESIGNGWSSEIIGFDTIIDFLNRELPDVIGNASVFFHSDGHISMVFFTNESNIIGRYPQ